MNDSIHEFASLKKYSLKRRILIHFADRILYALISLVGKTVRFETENLPPNLLDDETPIYAFWHDRIFLNVYFWRHQKTVVIVSQSFDGEYIARFVQRFGIGAVRGSSTRGGVRALAQMTRLMGERFTMGLTVDGPKGPRCQAKIGACLLAKKTGNPILPLLIEPKNFWTISSWDKLQIPRPFTRAKLIVGAPIHIARDADAAELENKRLELQNALDELTARGENWRLEI